MSATDERKLRSDNRRRHDRPDGYVPPGPVSHLVTDGQPTGQPSINEKKRRVISPAPAAEKSDDELRLLARSAAAQAIVNPEVVEIESLRKIDLALGILAKLGDDQKPLEEMSAEELQAALKSR